MSQHFKNPIFVLFTVWAIVSVCVVAWGLCN